MWHPVRASVVCSLSFQYESGLIDMKHSSSAQLLIVAVHEILKYQIPAVPEGAACVSCFSSIGYYIQQCFLMLFLACVVFVIYSDDFVFEFVAIYIYILVVFFRVTAALRVLIVGYFIQHLQPSFASEATS